MLLHDAEIGPDEVPGDGVGDVGSGQDHAGAEADFAVGVVHFKTAQAQFPIDAGEELGHGGASLWTGFVGYEGADGHQKIAVTFLAGSQAVRRRDGTLGGRAAAGPDQFLRLYN